MNFNSWRTIEIRGYCRPVVINCGVFPRCPGRGAKHSRFFSGNHLRFRVPLVLFNGMALTGLIKPGSKYVSCGLTSFGSESAFYLNRCFTILSVSLSLPSPNVTGRRPTDKYLT